MFHSSTTIYHFSQTTVAFTSGEGRMVFGVLSVAKNIAIGAGKIGGKLLKKGGRSASDNPFFRAVFSPFYLAGKAAKWSYDRGKDALYGAEWAGRVGYEAGAGVVGATARPALTLALSAARDVKMSLWDLPMATLRAAIRFPIAIAKSPLEMVRGVRDSIVSIPRNTSELVQNIAQLNVRESIKSVFKLGKDFITPPLARPLAPILNAPAKVISAAARTKIQYALSMKQAGEQFTAGYRRFRNSTGEASNQMAAVTATRLEQKQKRKEQEEEEKEENVDKVKQLRGSKGGGGLRTAGATT